MFICAENHVNNTLFTINSSSNSLAGLLYLVETCTCIAVIITVYNVFLFIKECHLLSNFRVAFYE